MIAREPTWIALELVRAIHERQLAEHGGGAGVRDQALLESAINRPRQLYAYRDEVTDLIDLAASYAFGISRNHPFIDGNKRTAAVVCELFLRVNGYRLLADNAALYPIFVRLASGDLEEAELASWLRDHTRPDAVSEGQAIYG